MAVTANVAALGTTSRASTPLLGHSALQPVIGVPESAWGIRWKAVVCYFGAMSRPSSVEGLSIARQRIAEEAERQTGFLNLARLGLAELPEGLFALSHLRRLSLGGAFGLSGSSDGPANRLGSEFARLAVLPELEALSVADTDCDELDFVADLHRLLLLDCSRTLVSDLTPVAKLTALQKLLCIGTQVSDLTPLAGLTALQQLNCSFNLQVSDLTPIAGLTALQQLECGWTPVSDLTPLTGLTALQWLDCNRTPVSDLTPLAGLTALQQLECSWTLVSDLTPLAGLTALQQFECSSTLVSDLTPLAGLTALAEIDFSYCRLIRVPSGFWHKSTLRRVILYRTELPAVPAEVLSQNVDKDCLESLRAHFNDLSDGAESQIDVKLLVLGNGRSGKTQIVRRLCNLVFQEGWDSTHGVRISTTDLSGRRDARATRLHIWDFGGQDTYHGTHALFLRVRAIFLLVWATDTSDPGEYERDGISFRNYPLAYWVDYVRHLAPAAGAIVVQTKCDRDSDEKPVPIQQEILAELGFHREVHFSAANNRGLDELEAALRSTISRLRDREGVSRIGSGRLRVQRRLEALRNADGSMPPEYRLLDQATFRTWCKETGGVSSPEQLLTYLHNAGVLFYQPGLFHDRIVLDHAWALNAIYAVFDRTRSYKQLLTEGGRFDRIRLEQLIWKEEGHSPDDQRLFLSMMQSCGMCFVYRGSSHGGDDDDTVYIAPDLLPDRAAVEIDLEDRWGFDAPTAEIVFEYPLLHAGLMRGLIARVGNQAGLNAVYWRGGVYVYETTSRSRAIIEQQMEAGAWAGRVRVQTKGEQQEELLSRLAEWIRQENQRLGLRPETKGDTAPGQPATKAEESHPLEFRREPVEEFQYCVSYAWGDDTPEGKERDAYVDQLCQKAARGGLHVLRDRTDMGLGERISEFMLKLAQGKRVFIILSDKYLRSAYCTFELYHVWRNSKLEGEEFRRRVRVFVLPEVKIERFEDRIGYYHYWKSRYKDRELAIRGLDSPADLPLKDLEELKAMKQFHGSVLEILGVVQDTLTPRSWDEFLGHGFADPPE